jgi:hypothetical protein
MTHPVDLDPVATVILFVLAAGVGWLLCRHR